MSDIQQPTLETEESPGVASSMRATVRFGRRVGAIMIAAGIALTSASLWLNRGFEIIPVCVLLVSTGAGMITGLGFAKAIQANAENR